MHAKVRFMFLDHFGANLVRKIKILKFATKANSNMQNSMVMFIFLFSTRNFPFEKIWFQNSKLLK